VDAAQFFNAIDARGLKILIDYVILPEVYVWKDELSQRNKDRNFSNFVLHPAV
jgi:hypothetical protein